MLKKKSRVVAFIALMASLLLLWIFCLYRTMLYAPPAQVQLWFPHFGNGWIVIRKGAHYLLIVIIFFSFIWILNPIIKSIKGYVVRRKENLHSCSFQLQLHCF